METTSVSSKSTYWQGWTLAVMKQSAMDSQINIFVNKHIEVNYGLGGSQS